MSLCADCNVEVLDGFRGGRLRWDPTFWLCVEDVIQECFLTGFMGWLPWCRASPPMKACPLGISRFWNRLTDWGPDERQQSEWCLGICLFPYFCWVKALVCGKAEDIVRARGDRWGTVDRQSPIHSSYLSWSHWYFQVQRNFSSVLV